MDPAIAIGRFAPIFSTASRAIWTAFVVIAIDSSARSAPAKQ